MNHAVFLKDYLTKTPGMIKNALLLAFLMTSFIAAGCKPASEGPTPSPSPTSSGQPLADLERLVQYVIERYQPAPQTGVAIAVVKDGAVVLSKAYGWRDRSSRLPVTESTLFAIGSTTKAFTSLVLNQLQAEKKLNLSSPVRSYYPGFAVQDPGASAQMTLVDMLAHRSGLPAHDVAWSFSTMSRAELMSRLQYFEMDGRPEAGFRRGFYYNNLIYTAAGVAAGLVAGQSWENLLRQKVLTPLNMGSCVFDAQLYDSGNFARPYLYEQENRYINPQAVGPAASLDCSLGDMVRWLKFHLRKGRAESGEQLLSEADMESMYSPQVTVDQGSGLSYGLGWYVISDPKTRSRTIFHPGTFGAYHTEVEFNPELGFGVVFMINQEMAEVLKTRLLSALDDYLKGKPYDQIVAALPAPPAFVPADLSAHTPNTNGLNENFRVARFTHPGYGEMRFYDFNGQGIAKYFDTYMLLTSNGSSNLNLWMRAVGDYVPVPLNFAPDSTTFSAQLNVEPVMSVFRAVR